MPTVPLWATPALDLSQAVVYAPAGLSRVGQKAAQVLVEEVAKRTRVNWKISQETPLGDGLSIVLGHTLAHSRVHGRGELADGFQISTQPSQITIQGNDARGLLFGVGYL